MSSRWLGWCSGIISVMLPHLVSGALLPPAFQMQEFELGMALAVEAANALVAAGPATPRAGDEAEMASAVPLLKAVASATSLVLRAQRAALSQLLGASLGEAFLVGGTVDTYWHGLLGGGVAGDQLKWGPDSTNGHFLSHAPCGAAPFRQELLREEDSLQSPYEQLLGAHDVSDDLWPSQVWAR